MVKEPGTLKGKPYPKFIRKHLIFKAFPNIEKIFPKLGLKNTKEKIGKISNDTLKQCAEGVIKNLALHINHCRATIRDAESRTWVRDNLPYYGSGHYEEKSESWKAKKRDAVTILSALTKALSSDPESFIKIKNNKISLRVPKKITSGDFSLASGRDLFNELKKLDGVLRSDGFSLNVRRIRRIIALSSPRANCNIVFTASGKEGLWDIATMSMRGISSCQRWGSSHATCLIGSMIDPYAGILYLTGGKSKYGTKMKKRAVVRLVINRTTRKPALMIERIYPHRHDNDKDHITLNIFTKFLENKTKNKYPVVYGERTEARKYFIPLSEPVEYLEDDEKSYRDSHIGYHEVNRDITQYLN